MMLELHSQERIVLEERRISAGQSVEVLVGGGHVVIPVLFALRV